MQPHAGNTCIWLSRTDEAPAALNYRDELSQRMVIAVRSKLIHHAVEEIKCIEGLDDIWKRWWSNAAEPSH
jgi:hypothetical protein